MRPSDRALNLGVPTILPAFGPVASFDPIARIRILVGKKTGFDNRVKEEGGLMESEGLMSAVAVVKEDGQVEGPYCEGEAGEEA